MKKYRCVFSRCAIQIESYTEEEAQDVAERLAEALHFDLLYIEEIP